MENGVRPKTSENTQAATDIALKYIIFLASDEERISAFCLNTGMGENDLKSRLTDPAFQAFLLDTLLQNETELVAFAAENGLKPESVMIARSKLPGFSE
jgi:hypothetical protein